MTNQSTGRASKEEKKLKPGFYYEEVHPSEKAPGASDKELGARWGAGKSDGKGRVTRKGSQTQTIPGTLETAQDEQEGHPEEASLDQPGTPGGDRQSLDQPLLEGGDRPNLDQPAPADDDRLDKESLDQPEGSGVDRQEGHGPNERRLSYVSEDDGKGSHSERRSPGPALDRNPWKQAGRRKRARVRSEASEVEGDLLATTGSDNEGIHNARYFRQSFSGEDNNSEGEDEGEHKPEEPPKKEEPVRKVDLEKEATKKRIDRKGKKPVRPVGFQDMMSSISRAGQRETVPRNEKARMTTAVTFGRDKNKIPHGLRFNTTNDEVANREVAARENPQSQEDGKGDGNPTLNNQSEDEEPAEPDRRQSRRRSDSSSPGSSSSSSTSSDGASSDHARRRRRHRRRHRSRSRTRRSRRRDENSKESKAEREERKAMERQKATPPSVYDGKADLLVFDKWTYEVNNWIRNSKYRDITALRSLVSYVSGEAGQFFMDYIAGNEDKWTIKSMYEALFDYCFPMDFKDRLRARLMNSQQGKRRIRDFIRDIEKLAARFPDVNERTVIQTFWAGMRREVRLRLIEWGMSPEDTPLEKMVRKAIDIENSEEAYRRELRSEKQGPPERSWGRFANRTDGPQKWKPSGDGEGSQPKKQDRVRASAVSPQQRQPDQSQQQEREPRKRGRRISRAKRDELRAAGKCFHCEETGHDQRNCPKLHSMRRPAANAARIEAARSERVSGPRGAPDVRVNAMAFIPENDVLQDDATDSMRRAYELCTLEWGSDERWLDVETRAEGRYGIYQYETGPGDVVEIRDRQRPEVGTLEVDSRRFLDPNFRLSDVHALNANANLSCSQEGGYRNRRTYQIWEWPALKWLRDTMSDQLGYESSEDRVGVWPAMDGYCLHLGGTDVFYGLRHSEVLGDRFNPRRVLNQMRAAKSIDKQYRPSIFRDSALNRQQGIMLHAIKLMVGVSQARKRTKATEGAFPVERTAMRLKDQSKKVPEPVVVLAKVNGQQIRALLDTGSMADFLSTTLVDQLDLRKEYYSKPLSVQLAVHGSRPKINCGVRVNFQYQNISCERRFDVANLDNYDAILGTPFLFQHKVAVGINPPCVVVGSDTPVKLEGPDVITINSAAADLTEDELGQLRNELRREAEDLCTDTSRTSLPPLRAVNHTIPLIDEHKVYRFRPSKCPEAFRDQWREKKEAYLATGRWRTATGHNAIPLLMIPKISSGDKPKLRTVFDKREQNQNTSKLASPLPDIEEILREVSKHKYRSIIDGKDAYEQIRVIPEHVSRTLFTTPDGTMESLVMQQGDCNAGATYQTLMNHIFASYIGAFMFVYLDDIIIFSDSIEEHVKHVKIILDILRKECLFLSPGKMQFFARELKILGHVIDDEGIRMDPHKVDKVLNWKTPTNKDLLRSFIGAVGFLAPDCKGIRVPMGHLSSLTAETKVWKWDDTAHRSFESVKQIVNDHRDRRRKALDYSEGTDPIYVTTDGCLTGGGGYVSQGNDPKTASVVAFWSGKWNAAQQNYPVHEQELLALVETLKRFRGVLQGTRFVVRTDHKALEYFMRQRNLSPRQHRWIDTLSEFDFYIQYIPGDINGFADALSRVYSDEPRGITRADSEFINEGSDVETKTAPKIHPVYIETYLLGLMNAVTRRSSRLADKLSPRYKETQDRKPRERGTKGDRPAQNQPDVPESTSAPEAPHAEPEPDRQPETSAQVGNRLFEVSSNLGISFPDCVRNRYNEDKFFEPILANPTEFTNFTIRDGLIYFGSEGVETVAIPDIQVNGRNVREVLISQGHSILAHLSDEKTVTYMRDQVWWKTMVKDVSDYCRFCQVCAVSKPQSGKPHGKLKTMPVPTYPWQYIGVDFVGPLPESSNRDGAFDMICVIIDQLTSMVHLVPTRQTYRATDVAELMFENVYKLHGLPERIVSDRDSLFTSKLWKRLHRLLGTELRMSSAFHPQTDGATERANRTITQMIRQCVRPDQKDWVSKLPAIEY